MMLLNNILPKAVLLGSVAVSAMISQQALAQPASTSDAASDSGEIVVTARKRSETALNVPVTVTAVGAAELNRRGINNLDALAAMVPGLTLMEQGGTMQGGTVSLRGITGPNSNALGDQAVSFVVDGVAVAKSSMRRMASFDMQQVEVLKGPQALFFGKNSPGGVVSMTTADPTSSLEAKLSAGYEFEAHEIRTEGYISGPLTDGLGARLAFYYDDARGGTRNIFPEGQVNSPNHDWIGRNKEYGLRGTLKYDDGGPFTARFKAAYVNKRGGSLGENMQPIYCGTGTLFLPYDGFPVATPIPGMVENCKADGKQNHPDIGPGFAQYATYDKRYRKDGTLFSKSYQALFGLELKYDVSDDIALTSVTGLYKARATGNSHYTYPYAETLLPSANTWRDREFSQELRLASSYDGPVNFMMGGLYSSTNTYQNTNTLFGSPPVRDSNGNIIFGSVLNVFFLPSPTNFNEYIFVQKGEAWSAFAQLQWKPVETVEVSVGGRYSHEEKKLTRADADFRQFPFGDPTLPPVSIDDPAQGIARRPIPDPISFGDFSPEVTLAWRPTREWNLYVSYKRAFLSGGYNGSSDVLLPGQRADYDQQSIKGFEAGVKASLLDNTLRFNLAGFTYKVKGLQVASYQNGVSTIRNAGAVSVKGFEADVNWQTPLQGLNLRGAAAYTHARYTDYIAPCWNSQTVAQGCDTVDPISGQPAQDLAGTPVPNAPDWALNAGFTYMTPVGSGMKFTLSGDVNYSSDYVTDSKFTPFTKAPSRALIDASASIGADDDRWELAFVGKNLTNKYYWTDSQGLFPAPSNRLDDRFANISKGRELWVRVSYKYR